MLFNDFDRSSIRILISIAIIAIAIFYLGSRYLGPGLSDAKIPLTNGYEYWDTGGDGKFILPHDSIDSDIAIQSRVDEYKTVKDILTVARKPKRFYVDNGILKSKLSSTCEILVIDTKKHEVLKRIEVNHLGNCRISLLKDN